MIKHRYRPTLNELERRSYLGFQRARNQFADPVPEPEDLFSGLSAQPTAQNPVPDFWAAQDEPRDYWIQAPAGRGNYYELLPELEARQHRDRLRVIQKFKAMRRKNIPLSTAQLDLFKRTREELRETDRRKRHTEVLDLDGPGHTKRVRTHAVNLTLHIYEPNVGGGVTKIIKKCTVTADTTIGGLKDLLDGGEPRLVPFRRENIRIDQYTDGDNEELEYPEIDIPDSKLIVDFLPERWLNKQKLVKIEGILEVNQQKWKLIGADGIEIDD